MTVLDVLCMIGLIASTAALVQYHWSIRRITTRARLETSRFPLFAARDHLVYLVASEQVREDEPAWGNIYASINSLLGLHQSLHLFDIVKQYTSYLARLRNDQEFAREALLLEREEKELSTRAPSFAEVRREIDGALHHLIKCRTSTWHMLLIAGFLVVLAMVVVAFQANAATAKFVGSTMFGKPSSKYMRAFALQFAE
jgi:hypothetical protein